MWLCVVAHMSKVMSVHRAQQTPLVPVWPCLPESLKTSIVQRRLQPLLLQRPLFFVAAFAFCLSCGGALGPLEAGKARAAACWDVEAGIVGAAVACWGSS